MVELGTIKLAHEIDKKSGRGSGKYYWTACPTIAKYDLWYNISRGE